jgi:uncharacterized protein YlxP (DUF503 family)
MGAVVGCLYLDLFLSQAQSLKDKRRVLRRVKDRAQQKFRVAVAEVDGLDLWQKAGLVFVAVANERQQVDRTLATLAEWAQQQTGFVVAGRRLEWR